MADPHWTSYVGMATGLMGSVLGFLAWRQTKKIKRLDLRIELRKRHSKLVTLIENCSPLIKKSESTKMTRAGVEGWLRGGRIESWKATCSEDIKSIEELSKDVPQGSKDFKDKSEKEIEDLIVKVERWIETVSSITSKHETSLSEDLEASKEKMRLANERYNKT